MCDRIVKNESERTQNLILNVLLYLNDYNYFTILCLLHTASYIHEKSNEM